VAAAEAQEDAPLIRSCAGSVHQKRGEGGGGYLVTRIRSGKESLKASGKQKVQYDKNAPGNPAPENIRGKVDAQIKPGKGDNYNKKKRRYPGRYF
jgi:hypothetical protein